MPGAAELLSRSACSTRRECPVTPQAASIWQGLLRSSERRPAATVCGYYGTVRRYERGPHACGNRRFRVFLKDFQCMQHRRIICFYSEDHNIQSDRSCGFEFESIERFTNDHSVVRIWEPQSPEAKMWHAIKSGCSGSVFEERYLERVSTQNLIGGTNGNHTHDTSWSGNNFKSFNPSD